MEFHDHFYKKQKNLRIFSKKYSNYWFRPKEVLKFGSNTTLMSGNITSSYKKVHKSSVPFIYGICFTRACIHLKTWSLIFCIWKNVALRIIRILKNPIILRPKLTWLWYFEFCIFSRFSSGLKSEWAFLMPEKRKLCDM